jgi:ELWxxDGT repeat protein
MTLSRLERIALSGLLLLLGLLSPALQAQPVVDLRADFNTGPNSFVIGGTGSAQSAAVGFAGQYYFSMRTAEHGTELWQTDGTPQNTRLAFDLCPGVCDGFPSRPVFHVEGSTLYFSASDGQTGVELWSLAAGASSPQRVADINPGAGSSSPDAFKRITFSTGGGTTTRTFFTATRPDVGRELWRLTGGQVQLEADLLAGEASSNPGPVQLCSTGQICTIAQGSGGGAELRLLSYANTTAPPSGSSGVGGLSLGPTRTVSELAAMGPNTFLIVRDSAQNRSELWTFASSAATPQQLDSAGGVTGLRSLVINAGLFRVFYARAGQLKLSDGTVAGTVALASTAPESLVSLGSRLLFTGVVSGQGRELHVSDGTAAGTGLLKELVAGSVGLPTSSLDYSQRVSGNGARLFIAFQDPAQNDIARLWVSDGTAAGTVNISGNLLDQTGFVGLLASSGTSVLLAHAPGATSEGEPWFSNGTVSGALPLGNFRSTVGDSFVSMSGNFGTRVYGQALLENARVRFSVDASDSSPPQPESELDFALGEHFGKLWFGTSNGDLHVRSAAGVDTALGMRAVTDTHDCYVERSGRLYFLVTEDGDFLSDVEIARSDGTVVGTSIVTNLSASGQRRVQSLCFEGRRLLAVLGQRLLFVGASANSGMELFALDAADNPGLLRDIRPGLDSSSPRELMPLSGRPGLPDLAVFVANDGVLGEELWVTDGTGQGTRLLLDIHPGSGSSSIRDVISDGRRVFFTANSPSHGRELYVSDGSSAGTGRVTDLFVGIGSAFGDNSQHALLAMSQGRVYFSAVSSLEPTCALFESDGSAVATRCAYDSVAHTLRAVGREAVALDSGALVFAAHRDSDGRELRLLFNRQLLDISAGDIAAGTASSNPHVLRRLGDRVLFAATGPFGEELYRLSVPDLTELFENGFEQP